MFLETLTTLMNNRGLSKAQLAKDSGIPYTTIDGFYKKGCENIKLSTLQKLANYFDVTLDYLINGNNFILSTHEKAVIMAYRNNPEMQLAVDRLLNISSDINNEIKVYRAAKSEGSHDDEIVTMSKDKLSKLKEAPETDDNF